MDVSVAFSSPAMAAADSSVAANNAMSFVMMVVSSSTRISEGQPGAHAGIRARPSAVPAQGGSCALGGDNVMRNVPVPHQNQRFWRHGKIPTVFNDSGVLPFAGCG